jgi:hypothetical protein
LSSSSAKEVELAPFPLFSIRMETTLVMDFFNGMDIFELTAAFLQASQQVQDE